MLYAMVLHFYFTGNASEEKSNVEEVPAIKEEEDVTVTDEVDDNPEERNENKHLDVNFETE